MSPAKVVVYAGPTISREEVLGVVPQARVRPPAARGDLLKEEWGRDDTAVIIDGYYRERLSVGHKEILWLLDAGVNVIGAASMGALRAAELSPYGMTGVGSVYRMYATGEVDGDDEVAILHGPAERGYPAGTVAMVNLRYGCQEGARTDLVPAAAGERIVEVAKARPFTHRTWDELAGELGCGDHDALRTLERMIGTGAWDLKRLDALSALRTATRRADVSGTRAGGEVLHGVSGTRAADPADARAADEAPADAWAADEAPAGGWVADEALTGVIHYEALRWRSTREYAPGRWMSDLDVLNAARLFGEDYPRLHEEVLTGLLAGFAEAQGLEVDAYARARLGAGEDPDLPPALASWLTGAEAATLPVAERLRLVMVRVWPVWQSADWRPDVLARVKESSRWAEWTGLVAHADEVAEKTRGRVVVPPPEVCAKLFLRHWKRGGTSAEVEMARRGFFGMEDLGRTVTRFFAMDVQNARAARTR
ncbi:TfuA-like protein [Sphaerisporangium corydalis]|uniref:TfuA-like protein n=1 Tax=Sphaerisporangium corydalis TaxID=1441875 RepID=A0ABV9EC25_9ACTN|nr:TfuA-like protein [Sphaerisporangium corydalis]